MHGTSKNVYISITHCLVLFVWFWFCSLFKKKNLKNSVRKKCQHKTKSPQKPCFSVCWCALFFPTIPVHGPCPQSMYMLFIYPEALHSRKLIFPFASGYQLQIASWLLRVHFTLSELDPVWLELVHAATVSVRSYV